MRLPLRTLASVTTVVLLNVALAPSVSAEEVPGAPTTLTGLVRVVPVEWNPATQDAPQEDFTYTLFPDDGSAPVEISGDALGAVSTGDTLSVIVDDSTPDDETLTVVDALIKPPVEAVVGAKTHNLNIAVMTLSGEDSNALFPASSISALVSNLQSYWVRESGGQVAAIQRSGDIKRFVGSCDAYASWATAAGLFGSTEQSYWDGTRSTPTHLVVLASPSCGAGNGLGSIGNKVHYGGEIWAVVEDDVQENQVMAHEFGHNISLGHSNLVECGGHPDVVESSAWCSDTEYGDYYDVMAGGYTYDFGGGTAVTENLAALNVTHRVWLDALRPGNGLQTVTLDNGTATQSVTVSLAAASATSGIRGVKITDPKSGDAYYLEYRSGTGIDANAFYKTVQPADSSYGVGVRVLRLRVVEDPYYPGESSAALLDTAATDPERKRFLANGQNLATPLAGITVTVTGLTPTTATVRIDLKDIDLSGVTDKDRVAGQDRYSTGVALSKLGFPGGAPVVYIATGTNYPDALAAGPAAAKQGGPLLLTNPTSLPAAVKAEIERLNPGRIVVVGGVNSVSASVEKALQRLVPNASDVIRLSGSDRYATGRAVVRYAFDSAETVFVATGSNFPDALSAGAAGAAEAIPVILLNGSAQWIDQATGDLLDDLLPNDDSGNIVIVGGPSAVSLDIEYFMWSYWPVNRISGSNRYETSEKINEAYFGPVTDKVFIATGAGFADALAGGAVASQLGAPLYVTQSSCVSRQLQSALEYLDTSQVFVIGGLSALNNNVLNLKRCA